MPEAVVFSSSRTFSASSRNELRYTSNRLASIDLFRAVTVVTLPFRDAHSASETRLVWA